MTRIRRKAANRVAEIGPVPAKVPQEGDFRAQEQRRPETGPRFTRESLQRVVLIMPLLNGRFRDLRRPGLSGPVQIWLQ